MAYTRRGRQAIREANIRRREQIRERDRQRSETRLNELVRKRDEWVSQRKKDIPKEEQYKRESIQRSQDEMKRRDEVTRGMAGTTDPQFWKQENLRRKEYDLKHAVISRKFVEQVASRTKAGEDIKKEIMIIVNKYGTIETKKDVSKTLSEQNKYVSDIASSYRGREEQILRSWQWAKLPPEYTTQLIKSKEKTETVEIIEETKDGKYIIRRKNGKVETVDKSHISFVEGKPQHVVEMKTEKGKRVQIGISKGVYEKLKEEEALKERYATLRPAETEIGEYEPIFARALGLGEFETFLRKKTPPMKLPTISSIREKLKKGESVIEMGKGVGEIIVVRTLKGAIGEKTEIIQPLIRFPEPSPEELRGRTLLASVPIAEEVALYGFAGFVGGITAPITIPSGLLELGREATLGGTGVIAVRGKEYIKGISEHATTRPVAFVSGLAGSIAGGYVVWKGIHGLREPTTKVELTRGFITEETGFPAGLEKAKVVSPVDRWTIKLKGRVTPETFSEYLRKAKTPKITTAGEIIERTEILEMLGGKADILNIGFEQVVGESFIRKKLFSGFGMKDVDLIKLGKDIKIKKAPFGFEKGSKTISELALKKEAEINLFGIKTMEQVGEGIIDIKGGLPVKVGAKTPVLFKRKILSIPIKSERMTIKFVKTEPPYPKTPFPYKTSGKIGYKPVVEKIVPKVEMDLGKFGRITTLQKVEFDLRGFLKQRQKQKIIPYQFEYEYPRTPPLVALPSIPTRVKIEPKAVIKTKITLKVIPKLVPKLKPKLVSKLMPKLASKISPKIATKLTPKLSYKLTPKLSYKLIPKLMPKLLPKLTPKVTLKVIPKITPFLTWTEFKIRTPVIRKRKKKKKKVKRRYKYTPSLTAMGIPITIPKAPKGKLTGLEVRFRVGKPKKKKKHKRKSRSGLRIFI